MNIPVSRAIGSIWCLALAAFVGGCESIMPQGLHDVQFVQHREFQEDEATIYAASQAALEAMNYVLVRGSRAAGTLEMASHVQPGSALRARQRRAVIEIASEPGGGCTLRIGFWEVSEDESASGTVTPNNRLLRDGMVYQVFWDHLTEKLSESKPAAAEAAP
jgi:hypothetical protein